MEKQTILSLKQLEALLGCDYNMDTGWALAISYDQVLVGKLKNGNLIFAQEVAIDRLMDLRIFNQEKQVRFLEAGIGYNGSKQFLISETIDEQKSLDDQYFVCLGNHLVREFDGVSTLVKDTDRGIILHYPFEITKEEIQEKVTLVVRNYYRFYRNQLIVTDSRLVGFCKGGQII